MWWRYDWNWRAILLVPCVVGGDGRGGDGDGDGDGDGRGYNWRRLWGDVEGSICSSHSGGVWKEVSSFSERAGCRES